MTEISINFVKQIFQLFMEINLGTQLDTRGELSLSDSLWLSYKRLLQLAFLCLYFLGASRMVQSDQF